MGDGGLGIGDWAQPPIPNPQSPIPNPHFTFFYKYFFLLINFFLFKLEKMEEKLKLNYNTVLDQIKATKEKTSSKKKSYSDSSE